MPSRVCRCELYKVRTVFQGCINKNKARSVEDPTARHETRCRASSDCSTQGTHEANERDRRSHLDELHVSVGICFPLSIGGPDYVVAASKSRSSYVEGGDPSPHRGDARQREAVQHNNPRTTTRLIAAATRHLSIVAEGNPPPCKPAPVCSCYMQLAGHCTSCRLRTWRLVRTTRTTTAFTRGFG